MNETLAGKAVAILVTDGFEQAELEGPRRALQEAGAITRVVAPRPPGVRAWNVAASGSASGTVATVAVARQQAPDAKGLVVLPLVPSELARDARIQERLAQHQEREPGVALRPPAAAGTCQTGGGGIRAQGQKGVAIPVR